MNANLRNRKGRRSPSADAHHRAEVERERATRAFLGDDTDSDARTDDLADLADEAETVRVGDAWGLRAAEEL